MLIKGLSLGYPNAGGPPGQGASAIRKSISDKEFPYSIMATIIVWVAIIVNLIYTSRYFDQFNGIIFSKPRSASDYGNDTGDILSYLHTWLSVCIPIGAQNWHVHAVDRILS